jgi:DNA-binding MarR family transcriptional regulator
MAWEVIFVTRKIRECSVRVPETKSKSALVSGSHHPDFLMRLKIQSNPKSKLFKSLLVRHIMKDRILGLVAESKVLNSKVFSLPRLLILTALEDLGEDGSTYRELKAGLDMEDGALFSNLVALEAMEYVKKTKVELENKEMHSYSITSEGKETLGGLRSWLRKWMGDADG